MAAVCMYMILPEVRNPCKQRIFFFEEEEEGGAEALALPSTSPRSASLDVIDAV
eukprot:CAMPEP_0173345032 /NCGR_PEP_ID=MMETSP1144-20121109/11747_1 /TAXON_ID=483371 /ORGANISM="non described non described, Strain CCMP2298" /LENGTH=53 /DNA_ID=CAMNT_0014292111 /DNA_START=839 /DNA_END=996 /DNA_ORIENTATION=+